ncbi:MAG: L-threonylcarbamoyladenylate synthase [bacterium]|nr:L-threonylcarbamoyladenylate synthase [bacterium]
MKIIDLKKDNQAGEAAIKIAMAFLKKGGLVICPTETCYIPAVDATNPKAVEKLIKYKGNRKNKPISVAVSGRKMAERYVEINEVADNLYKNFLPGPVTVISKSKGRVVEALEGLRQTLGIRMPDYSFTLKLIEQFGRPLTSTSANVSGVKTPYSLKDILKYTPKRSLELIDLFLDAGQLPLRPTSTVVDTTLNELAVLRQGEIIIPKTKDHFFISESEEKTKSIASEIFEKYKKSLNNKVIVFALQGELGSGKTQFAKGLALALRIKSNVVSPTFNVIREYPFSLKGRPGMFYHLDTWRLERGEELLDFGFLRMLKPGNVIAIEWVQKMVSIIKNIEKRDSIQIVWVNIDHISETKRNISFKD